MVDKIKILEASVGLLFVLLIGSLFILYDFVKTTDRKIIQLKQDNCILTCEIAYFHNITNIPFEECVASCMDFFKVFG